MTNESIQTELTQNLSNKQKRLSSLVTFCGGVVFTFLIALLGFLLSKIPGFSYVGQMAWAMIIAIGYRQFFGYPEILRRGITFSAKIVLRTAIILYGLRLNMQTIMNEGFGLLFRDAFVIGFAIVFMVWLAKKMTANPTISLLTGVGTGICGAAAIATVAPIINAKDEDTAISVGMIALMGTFFSILYTVLRPIIPLSASEYGIWSGISLHELAHVSLAAAPAGQDALALALLAKLGRVFLLIPFCFLLIFLMKRKKYRTTEEDRPKIVFPWFLIGFIICSLLGSYVFGQSIPVSDALMEWVYTMTTWLLTAAMVGLGLSVSFQDLRSKAMRPLLAMTVTSICVSVITFFIV